ncbi:MAG: LPS export ABC transporter periplasmic protein LptC [Pseudomonadota bacterium]
MSKRKVIVGVVCSAIVVGMTVAVWKIVGERETLDMVIQSLPSANIDVSVKNVHHESVKNGSKEWVMDASKAEHIKDGDQVLFSEIRTTFFLKDGKTVLLTAKSGILHRETQDVDINRDVKIQAYGYRILSEKISYLHDKQMLISKIPIYIESKDLKLSGNDMEFDLQSERLKVSGDVRAEVTGKYLGLLHD